jgi:hypothetical protein
MARFADLRNDVAFHHVFGKSPEVLGALLDDLLGREGPSKAEVLAIDQAPEMPGAVLPLASVRCRDARRTTYIVELQIVAVPGFLERSLHEACRAYVEQPRRGYADLGSVVAVSICDFELWPDRAQDAKRAMRVPMLSRWRMTESDSGADGPGLVQHVVLELPKLAARAPESGAERWAWLFRNAVELDEIPPSLPDGPQRRALARAELSTWSRAEIHHYRRAREAVAQTREAVRDAEARGRREGLSAGRHEGVVQGKRDGLMEGEAKGRRDALREAILVWAHERGLTISAAERARVEGETRLDALATWIARAPHAESMADLLAAAPPEPTPPPPATMPPPADSFEAL